MIDLLRAFSTLSLISGAILTILPDGSLRKTAALTLGLMLMLCWVQGLTDILRLPQADFSQSSALSATALSLNHVQHAAEEFLIVHAAPEVTPSP